MHTRVRFIYTLRLDMYKDILKVLSAHILNCIFIRHFHKSVFISGYENANMILWIFHLLTLSQLIALLISNVNTRNIRCTQAYIERSYCSIFFYIYIYIILAIGFAKPTHYRYRRIASIYLASTYISKMFAHYIRLSWNDEYEWRRLEIIQTGYSFRCF